VAVLANSRFIDPQILQRQGIPPELLLHLEASFGTTVLKTMPYGQELVIANIIYSHEVFGLASESTVVAAAGDGQLRPQP
jgi:hypothetical protein